MRVERVVPELLEVLQEYGVGATFFVLGSVARKCPNVVQKVVAAGHEVGSHGYGHEHLDRMSPKSFREDVRASRAVLEDMVGRPIAGFRAPTFSVTRRTAWAVEILIEEGFAYDSSVFPIFHDRYGVPEAPGEPHWLCRNGGRILELPPLTLGASLLKLPVGGGGYLRVLPMGLVRRAIRRANRRGLPAVLYVHPWELDPDEPRVRAGLVARLRHYAGIRGMQARVRGLLEAFAFRPMRELAAQQAAVCRREFWL